MVGSNMGLAAEESSESKDSPDEELYRKLQLLKSKLEIDFNPPKNEPYDFIFIVVHGIGTTDTMLQNDYKNLKQSLEVVRKHWFYNQNLKIHLLFINWKKYIVDAQNTLFDNVAIDTVRGMRRSITLAVLDLTFYFNPKFSDYLLLNVANDINGEISTLRNHPSGLFNESKIVMLGYSMGSVLVDDLIRINPDRMSNVEPSKRPRVDHKVDYYFAIGSPLSCFILYHTPQIIKSGWKLPEHVKYYNVFHPYDPIATRWEKLIYREIENIPKPVILPYWQNNGFKNWYNIDQQLQYCKSFIVDNLSDVANSITKGLTSWLGSSQNNSVLNQNITSTTNSTVLNSYTPRMKAFNNFRNQLKRKGEAHKQDQASSQNSPQKGELQGQEEDEDDLFSDFEHDDSSSKALEKMNLNPSLPVRYDYQVQEDATEHFLNPLAILQSHISYWGSRDVSFFVLNVIHGKREKVSVTTLLTHIELKAKSLSVATTDEALKKEFLEVAEKAKSMLEEITKEEIRYKNESILVLKSTWNFMTKTADEGEDLPYESLISDNIEHEDGSPQTK